ncbi:DNA repair protein RecN [Bacillus taeanensis]|uniref:DNA repair protein RecN n=1 Tax=Bacillus taeanensis TaxID=273032 RepID=A0A366XYB6_9BACI|nr:DNA repair protein RecN [Bacillus taeanensis]RBW70616.1 DNA repair protein RecN [Bacillus taeanensis]
MLAEISIKNFAIIEAISLSFEKGLTVITGETGAGKSIIIDAIGLLVGGRGSSEFVRYGEKKAEIEGLFLIDEAHPCHDKLRTLGIESDEEMIVLRRDISSNGKSVCRINGKLVTLGILREVGRSLIDIHGQHEHQELMQAEQHLSLLDRFGEKEIQPAFQEYQKVYVQFQKLMGQVNKLTEDDQQMAHRLDLIQYQLDEIQKANLEPNEDEVLLDEKTKLANYEKLFAAIRDSYHALYGDNKGLDWIGHAMGHLEEVSEMDSSLKKAYDGVSNSFYVLEEAMFALRDYYDQLEFDPNRLDFIEARLNEINMLKRKYGESVEQILEYAAAIEDEIDQLQNRDHHVEKMQAELKSITLDLTVEAKNLTTLRKKVAQQLTASILEELKQLYMEKTTFNISIELEEGKINRDPVIDGTAVHFKKDGIDQVEFLISTNPGEPLKSLSKVASGGELSRIMLALKSIFSVHQKITSIIFDEVDTGVSGRVAQAMAEKIYRLSNDSQVFCITHLPQVAAMADTHLYIAKQHTEDGRTSTKVTALEKNEKIKEIGRMISGVEITELTKQHANELLNLAADIKSTS